MTTSGPSSDVARGLQPALIAFAIRFRGVVAALALVLLGYGALAVARAKYDVFPEFAPPQVGIQTEAPGLTPAQIEVLVTQPIENAVTGVPGVETLRSSSVQGLSVVTVTFDPGSDIYRDRQVVAERLAFAAQRLPTGIKPPNLTPLTSSTSTVLVAGLTSETRSLMDLRASADWVLRLRLLAVSGVAKVAVFGGDLRTVQVQVHPDQLIRYGIGLDEVVAAARRATGVRGAGFVDTPNQRIVFQVDGQAIDPVDIGRTVLTGAGATSVLLRDLATVVDAPAQPIGGASVLGHPGVVMVISAQFGTNTVEVTRRVEEALASLRPGLQAEGITLDSGLFRPADFIGVATGNVRDSLLLGGLFVIVVLFLFLFDWRTAAISCIAIPLSLLAGVIVLNALGITLNTMTLGGLAIAIGEVVDDAVIDVENIVRRLRENQNRPSPRPPARVILAASLEVRGAVVYATFTVILVFLPILILPGIAGRFFAPLGLAYILAIVASLLVALTVTPALCMMLLGRRAAIPGRSEAENRPPPVVRWTRGRYEQVLTRIVGRPRLTILVAAAFTLIGSAALPFFGSAFLPEFKEGHYTLHMSAIPGTSIAESLRLGARVTKALTDLPVIRSVSQRVGRAEEADDTWGPNYSEIEVDLQPGLSGAGSSKAEADIRAALVGFPGVGFSLKPFLTERVEETVSGYTASVVVNIYGHDLDELDAVAKDVARVIGGVKGAKEVQLQAQSGMPQLTIKLRKDDLIRWGLDTVEVLDLVRSAYQGDVVGQAYDGNRVIDVVVLLDPASRASIANVGDLPIRTRTGLFVTLKQVADLSEATGRYQVDHLGAQRLQTVTANVGGRDVTSFVDEASASVASNVRLPAGVYLEFGGSAKAQAQARRDLVVRALIATVGVLLLLSIVTRHWRNLMLVLVNVPFALVGGVLAVLGTGGLLTLGSMVGFVALFGISLRNSIMMIAHYEHLVANEGNLWNAQTAIAGAGDRVTPIVMTSLVTALGLLPLAVGMGDPGREIQGPMALVILGGLLTSMVLNLLVLPTLALSFGRFGAEAVTS